MGAAPLEVYVPRMLLGPRADAGAHHWRAEGSLLFCDVSGFTRLSEQLARQGKVGAEELVTNLSRVYTALLSATDDGGDLLKFSGDAMVVFYEGDDHARRAVHAAQGMRRALVEVGGLTTSQGRVRLRMSTGIHSGEFRFFLCGDDHLELLAAGPGVSATVQMEGTAEAGEILLSPSTAAALDASALGRPKGEGVLLRRLRPIPPTTLAPQPGEDALLAARFIPRVLRERLGTGGAESEHRLVTIAFLQFKGTDALLAEHGPDDVFDRLQRLTLAVQAATARYEVCIIATDIDADGGKFMLAAGAPYASEDDEGRMLRTCLDILSQDIDLPIRIGVNRGHVFGGDVGAPFRRTYSTMGDATNLAARLMGKAPMGGLLAHRSVLQHTRDRFETEAVAPFLVKGKSAPIEASIVRRLLAAEGPTFLHLPLVGRVAELQVLRTAMDSADAGRGEVVEVVGDPGSGRSRMLGEAAAFAGEAHQLELSCDPYDRATPYASARVLLRQALGISAAMPRDEVGELLRARSRQLVPDLEPLLPLLGPVLQVDLPTTQAVEELAPRFRLDRTHTVVTSLLVAAVPHAQLRIDDATWMDDASAALLASVLRRTRDRRWLVVIGRGPERTGLHDELGYGARTVALEPLRPDAVRQLLAAATVDHPLPPRTRTAIAERGAGNPLFLLELVAAAQEDADGALPSTVEAILASRIDRLSAQDRGALRDLAVLGVSATAEMVDGVLGTEGTLSGDERRWRPLADFVSRRADGTLTFRSALHRDAAYEGLTFARRRELHARTATWLEGAGADRPELVATLAWHFHEAARWGEAWRHSVRAGDQARAAFANVEAADAYRRALDAARHLPELPGTERARVAELLGDAAEAAGRYEAAREAYRQARRLVTDDLEAAVRLLRKEGVVEERAGRYRSALRGYSRGLQLADTLSDPRSRTSQRAELAAAYAAVRFRQGRMRDCVDWARQAIGEAESCDAKDALAHAHYLLEAASGMLGSPLPDEQRELPLRLYEETGNLLGQGDVLNNLGITAYYAGRWEEALHLYGRSRDAFSRVGDDVASATAANNIAEILSDQGRLVAADELFREALSIWRSVDYRIGIALATSNLALVALRRGDPGRALEGLEEALRRFTELGSSSFVTETRVRLAEAYLASGRWVEAWQEASEARASVGGEDGLTLAITDRLMGSALLGCGGTERGLALLRAALEEARAHGSDLEVARCLDALADHEADRRAERRAEAARLLAGLGIRRQVPTQAPNGSMPDGEIRHRSEAANDGVLASGCWHPLREVASALVGGPPASDDVGTSCGPVGHRPAR